MVDTQLNIKHAFTSRIFTGGSKSESGSISDLTTAKKFDKPTVSSSHRYTGDHVLNLPGRNTALVLGRMQKKLAPMDSGSQPKPIDPPKTVSVPQSPPSNGSVGSGPSGSPSTPPKTDPFQAKLGQFREGLAKLDKEFASLKLGPSTDTLSTPSEKREAEARQVNHQAKLRTDGGKLLGEIGGALKEKRDALAQANQEATTLQSVHPIDHTALNDVNGRIAALKTDIGDLLEVRAKAIEIQIGAEFPRLGASLTEPLTKGGVITSLWSLHNTTYDSRHAGVTDASVKTLGKMIDAFSGGATEYQFPNGDKVSIDEFPGFLRDHARMLGTLHGLDKAGAAAGQLNKLADEVKARLDTREVVKSFARILDRDPNFPVGGALKSMAASLPSIREDGNSADPHALERAADGLKVLAEMIFLGQHFEGLHGHDAAFDKASIPFKLDRGARMGERHVVDGFEAQHGPVPPGLLDIARKPSDQWTQTDRATLVGYFSPLRNDMAAVETACTTLREAPQKGREAAQLRHELTLVNKRLADVLTVNRSRWFKPWTWGDTAVRVFGDSASSVKKDAALLKALKSCGDGASGKDVAFLMASIATLEAKTMKAEHLALGLHPNIDLASFDPKPGEPLAHVGITNKDLQSIGVTPTEIGEVEKLVTQMNRQGVGGVDDIHEVTRSINDVAKIVLKSELTQSMVQSYQNESALALGREVLEIIVTDADTTYRKAHLMAPNEARTGERSGLSVTDPTVSGRFKDQMARLERNIGGSDKTSKEWRDLNMGSTAYRLLEGNIAKDFQEHVEVEKSIESARKTIEDARPDDKLGISVSSQDPRGLRSAKKVLEAIRHHEEFEQTGDPQAKARRDEALKDLRGYDTTSMHRSGWAKITAKFRDAPTIDDIKDLKQVCEAIVTIREDGPKRLETLEKRIEETGQVLNTMAMDRMRDNPELRSVVNLVRAAVLHEWTKASGTAKVDFSVSKGEVLEGFDPSSGKTREAIDKLLTAWGVDLDAFAPEIDSVLFSRMSPADMKTWFGQMTLAPETVDRLHRQNPALFSKDGLIDIGRSIKHAFTIDGLLNRKVMDDRTKTELLSMLASFKEGDKLDLRAGQRITVDSGKIPVEPTGLVGIKAKLSGAHLGQFEIERGSDGYKLHLRTGGEVRGGLDLVVGKKFDVAPGVELTAEGSVGVEGRASRITGVSISFDNTDDGCRALVDLVAKMVDGEEIDLWDWKDARDVGDTVETRTRLGAAAQVVGRAQVGGKGPKISGTSDTLGVGIQGQVGVGIARGTKTTSTQSLNEGTFKGEVEISATIGASVSAYARIYNPLNIGTGALASQGGQQGANSHFGMSSGSDGVQGTSDDKPLYNISDNVQNTDLASIGLSKTVSYVSKWKQVVGPDGLFKKCEKVRQANFRQGVVEGFAAVDNSTILGIVNAKGNEAFKKDFETFMSMVGSRDFIAVTYNLNEDRRIEANGYLEKANLARRRGDEEGADYFDGLARSIVNDDANYEPAKIGLITTSVRQEEVTNLNARWLKWDTFTDGKTEHTGMTLAIVKPK